MVCAGLTISKLLAEWRQTLGGGNDISAIDATAGTLAEWKPSAARITWVGVRARELWERRLERLPMIIERLTVRMVQADADHCAIRLIPESRFQSLLEDAVARGLAATILPPAALPDGIFHSGVGEGSGALLVANKPWLPSRGLPG